MKNKKEIILLVILLIIQTIIFVYVASNKPYLHIDEGYSFGLTNYDKVEIMDNEDFFDTWHTKDYFEDYLAVQEDEKWDFTPVYENQKNDVHPPLYYLLLRICMEFTSGHYTPWPGFVLNIIVYLFVTIFMYLILKELFKDDEYASIKSMVLAFVASITLASISNVIYIRMYALLTLEVLITTYLHIKLLKRDKINLKLLIFIGISTLAGVLTHYYYLLYLAPLYLVFLIKYIKQKQYKKLLFYTLTLIIAGVVSLLIFPYSIEHMFFSYRGQGVMDNLHDSNQILTNLGQQIVTLNYYTFNKLTLVIAILIIGIWLCNKIRKKANFKLEKNKKEILLMISIPTIFFFLITSIASPWRVLRYMVAVSGLIFVLAIYWLYKELKNGFSNKVTNIVITIVLGAILISPFILKLEPELLYADRKDFVQEISGELKNVPTIYLFDSSQNRLFDDILVFSMVDNSYIAKDIEYTEENIKKIFADKDVSNGVIILLDQGDKTDGIINTVKNALNLEDSRYLQRLTSCDVYYVY